MNNKIKGYKVFDSDWTCRGKKYECPGIFEEDVTPSCCNRGMHFCVNLVDCFNYYNFNPENKVAEVIALGETDTEDNKICTNKLQIIREIPWEEVLRIVNSGAANTGNRNTGDWNTGDCNSGNQNTGNRNTGDWNTGNRNPGNRNTGAANTGNRNTGDWNTGNWNTGNRNPGNRNTGDCNSGNQNTGNRNTGDWNTGDCNTGDCNSGDWNKTDHSSGCFNTEEANIMLFNKMSDWTYWKWFISDARRLLNGIPKWCTEWVISDNMTEQEKADHPSYKVTGGYLKLLDESEEAQKWWDNLSTDEREIIRAIPNFDPDIFKECTGIDVKG